MPIEQTLLNLGVALLLGTALGFEREWRQRLAGLRTNVLVTVGAASFTLFSLMYPDEVSPTRVGAQVVSGIGFLGAGVILRSGANVRGLTTAATLWCAAAVGVLAGAGFLLEAAVATGLILVTNVLMLPLDGLINRYSPRRRTESDHHYTIRATAAEGQEADVRAQLLREVTMSGLHLQSIESRGLENQAGVEVRAELVSPTRSDEALEQVVGRLSLLPPVSAASWHYLEDRAEQDEGPPRFLRKG